MRSILMNLFITCILVINKTLIQLLPFKKIVSFYSNTSTNEAGSISNYDQVKCIMIRKRLERALQASKHNFVCYEQALTVLFLAKVHRVSVSMFYAIKREDDKIKAHAWTCSGDTYICGDMSMEGYKPIYQISYNPRHMRDSRNSVVRLLYHILKPMYRSVMVVLRFCTNAEFRSIQWNLLTNNKAVHQTTTYTSYNRYPFVFEGVKEIMTDKEQLKILSFGCSTGEEVETIRAYFPNATIVGADINKECLKSCQKRIFDEKVKFIISSQDLIHKQGPYDAIFCMAVLQRLPHKVLNEGITNISTLYPFRKFEDQLIELDKHLNVNGLLIVHFTQYNFLETSISHKYEPIEAIRQTEYPTPIFDKDGCIVEGSEQYYSVYIKINK